MSEWRVIEGDCIEVMAAMDEASVDAIVCDPPYGLEFMGKDWDRLGKGVDVRQQFRDEVQSPDNPHGRAGVRYGYGVPASVWRAQQEWHESWGRAALRVLKPGGYILAFGGTRTYHRLASGLQDAGFEVRDMIEWLYGSGFPKHGSTLKPAHEPIVLGRKAAPKATLLNIDACRIDTGAEVVHAPQSDPTKRAGVVGTDLGFTKAEAERFQQAQRESAERTNEMGRWPANVVLDPEAAAMLDRQSGTSTSRVGKPRSAANGEGWGMTATGAEYDDFGGASRFFYCAKAGRDERNAGLGEDFAKKPLHWSSGEQSPGTFQSDGTEKAARNHHPTVKPIDLMRWLCRLVTPKGGIVLDPFTGSGTTGCAAVLEDFDFIGIEREAEYAAIARARIAHWWAQPIQIGFDLEAA